MEDKNTLTDGDIANLNAEWNRLLYFNDEFNRLQDSESFYNLQNTLTEIKSHYESFADQAQGVDWFQDRINRIDKSIRNVEEIGRKVKEAAQQIPNAPPQLLPSERSVNRAMFPTKKTADEDGKVIYYFELKESNLSITGYWNSQSYVLMDYLTKKILEGEDRFKNAPVELNNNENQPCKYWVRFTNKEFKEATGKAWMQSRDICNLISQVGGTRVKNLRYGIIVTDEGGNKTYKTLNFESNFFSYGNQSTDNEHYIFFDTMLGQAFVENVLKKMNDTVQISLYELSGYAQILYRKFILVSRSHRIKLKVDTVIKGLNLSDKNRNHEVKTIHGVLSELLSKGFISEFTPKEISEISSLTKQFLATRADIKGQRISQIEKRKTGS